MKNENVVQLKHGTGFMNDGGTKPIQITYTNISKSPITVNAFETFKNNNSGINLQFTSGNDSISVDFFKKYFYENPHLSCLMRIQCASLMSKQAEKVVYLVNRNPMGEVAKEPAFVPLDVMNKAQFQSGILDIPYSFLLDGLSSDLEFDLMPETTVVLTLFFSHKCNDRNKKGLNDLRKIGVENNEKFFNFKYMGSFVIENNSDEEKEFILLDANRHKEYMMDSQIRIYDLFSFASQDMCDMYSNRNDYFNSIRIFSNGGKNNMKQIVSPIEFNSGNKYYPAIEVDGNQFQSCVNDVNIVGEELSLNNPILVTVMPKTTVVYLFKQYDKITNSSTKNSFYNISVQNKSDESKKVNIVDIFDDIKGGGVSHKIGKNRLEINGDNFTSDFMRVMFYDEQQVENPILITCKDEGKELKSPIFPLCYLNENNFRTEIVDIPMSSISLDKKNEVLFDLPKKGDGANIIFGKTKRLALKYKDNRHLMFPIWFENNTDEVKIVVLENDITNYKDMPEGVTCKVGIDSSYRELLSRFEGHGSYSEMILNKIYSRNTAQITQIIGIEDYTNIEAPVSNPLITQSYFSAMQFHSGLLSINGGKGYPIFNLNRIAGENEIKKDGEGNEYNTPTSNIEKKQRITFSILGKTKLALICSLEKKSISSSDNDEKDYAMSAGEIGSPTVIGN